MKVKAAEIARQLGLSKATVSLALNNKPGVSSQTKKMILDYINQIEYETNDLNKGKIIKIIYCFNSLHITYNEGVDLWRGVIEEFVREAKKDELQVMVDYVDLNNQSEIDKAINDCYFKEIVGVILFAMEMTLKDFESFKRINKPMIVYDNDLLEKCSSIMIDNDEGIKKCIARIQKYNHHEITYLANTNYNFNFIKRRDAFLTYVKKYGLVGDIRFCSNNIDDIYKSAVKLFQDKKVYKAIICENYQVSIGVLKAIHDLHIDLGNEIILIGIDEIPEYLSQGYQLTTLKIVHSQRAYWAMQLLKKEIQDNQTDKFKILSHCELILGNTG